MERDGLSPQKALLYQDWTDQGQEREHNGEIRMIFLRSHLRSMAEAVTQTSFLCSCSNALSRNEHTIIYM